MKRSIWLLSAIVVLAMGSALYEYVAPDQVAPTLTLSESEGQVTLERMEVGAIPPAIGTELAATDRVLTGAVGRATLTLGDDTHIHVRPSSSIEVVDIDDAGVSLELEEGAIRATVRPDSGAVRVGHRGSQVLQVHGEMEVGVQQEFMLVRAVEGDVALSGMDAARLEEGQQAQVVEQHVDVAPIPEELLLEVAWPDSAQRTNERTKLVRGVTEPRAQVVVEGPFGSRTVWADAQGQFTIEVPLVEGPNPTQVQAANALGESALENGALPERDTTASRIRARVRPSTPR